MSLRHFQLWDTTTGSTQRLQSNGVWAENLASITVVPLQPFGNLLREEIALGADDQVYETYALRSHDIAESDRLIEGGNTWTVALIEDYPPPLSRGLRTDQTGIMRIILVTRDKFLTEHNYHYIIDEEANRIRTPT